MKPFNQLFTSETCLAHHSSAPSNIRRQEKVTGGTTKHGDVTDKHRPSDKESHQCRNTWYLHLFGSIQHGRQTLGQKWKAQERLYSGRVMKSAIRPAE